MPTLSSTMIIARFFLPVHAHENHLAYDNLNGMSVFFCFLCNYAPSVYDDFRHSSIDLGDCRYSV
jgi:hypothetical protein